MAAVIINDLYNTRFNAPTCVNSFCMSVACSDVSRLLSAFSTSVSALSSTLAGSKRSSAPAVGRFFELQSVKAVMCRVVYDLTRG